VKLVKRKSPVGWGGKRCCSSPVSRAEKTAAACWNGDGIWMEDAARKALAAGSQLEREVAMMRYGEEKTLAEVAITLGITPSRVDKLFRGFAKKAKAALDESFSLKKGG